MTWSSLNRFVFGSRGLSIRRIIISGTLIVVLTASGVFASADEADEGPEAEGTFIEAQDMDPAAGIELFRVPDTGQTKCYSSAGVVISCSGTGQDGAYNINPMSFTDNGNGVITDNVTGLMWQKISDNALKTWDNAVGYCDGLSLGGYSDWRLPSKKELISILDYGTYNPAVNTTYFPDSDTSTGDYTWSSGWTSTAYAVSPDSRAWQTDTAAGDFYEEFKFLYKRARCVRGQQSSPTGFTNNGNGTVTHNYTGLMWQREDDNALRTWDQALAYCEGLVLGGYGDWRLPNLKELETINDDTRTVPTIDQTYFPNTDIYPYWTSTTSVGSSTGPSAWNVGFYTGQTGFFAKTTKTFVRCARGSSGQGGDTFNLAVVKKGAGGGKVASSPEGIICGADCSEGYDPETVVTLTATPAAGSVFGSWQGCDTVNGNKCTVTMSADKAVTAIFKLKTYKVSGKVTTLTLSGSPLSGATVKLKDKDTGTITAKVTTNSFGNYTFAGVAPGSYKIIPSKSGYAFTPGSRSVTVGAGNITGRNFVGTAGSQSSEM